MTEHEPPQFPHYPQGIPQANQIADPRQAGPLHKLMTRMLKAPGKRATGRAGKGLTSSSNVHIARRKQKFY